MASDAANPRIDCRDCTHAAAPAAIRLQSRLAIVRQCKPSRLAIEAILPLASSFAHFLWIRLCASRSTVEKIVDLKEYFFREQE
jgi:hypothetical protein